MDSSDKTLSIIVGIVTIAMLVYLWYNRGGTNNTASNSPTINSSALPYPSFSPAGFNTANPGTINSTQNPFNLPAINIPGTSVTINSGPRLFPLFGYAV